MVQLVGFCVIAVIVIIYLVIQYVRGNIPYSLSQIVKVLLLIVIFFVGWLVIPIYSIASLGWIGAIVAVLSFIISFWIAHKLSKLLSIILNYLVECLSITKVNM